MGEYTGRRRGRAAPEPLPQEPEYPYGEQQPGYEYYEQPAAPQYGYEYAPEYTQDPAYGYQDAPSYEQYPSYEQQQQQQPSYEQPSGFYEQPGYESGAYYETGNEPYPQQAYAEDYQGYQQEPHYEEPYYQQQPYSEQPYSEQPSGFYEQPGYEQPSYEQPYAEQPYSDQPYTDQPYSDQPYSEQPYEEPPFEPRRRSRSAPVEEPYADPYSADAHLTSYDPPQRLRAPLSPLSHLPYTAAATAALAVAAYVSTKAVAAVVLPLQLVVAWAVLDLAGFASRRTAVLAALPALAGTVATFKFQADDAVLPIAAGLGAGFVLVAADAVFRARRRGVEPGSVRALAAAASALLFAGLTGLFLPAAALHTSSVAVGAAVCGLASLLAARNPELGASRAAVVAIPVTIAALASYAAAILVP